MRFNGVVNINEAIEFNLSVQRIGFAGPHLHHGTNDSLCFTISLRSISYQRCTFDLS